MNFALTAITPTRDRPATFELCRRWMNRQTFDKPVQWIIVDDGDTPVTDISDPKAGFFALHIRRSPSKAVCTLPDNLLSAIPKIEADRILIWEDDEYYAPTYLEKMYSLLDADEMVGESMAHYYNVQSRRWFLPPNQNHASLCRTAFRKSIMPHFIAVCDRSKADDDPYVDLRLWGLRSGFQRPASSKLIPWMGLSVGIKGMPGRGGLGKSHRPLAFRNTDPHMAKLKEWMGTDSTAYERFANQSYLKRQ